jgi:ergothioneine biosynthesis protein EgtB
MKTLETHSEYPLYNALQEVRKRLLELVEDLSDEQMLGPLLPIVNPLRWEIGHVAFFQEYWVLRHARQQPPILSNGDALYDSARVAHDTRWDLPLPSKKDTLDYMRRVLERVINPGETSRRTLTSRGQYDEDYFLQLVLLHECMHAEAITYTRQTLGYPAPRITPATSDAGRRAVPLAPLDSGVRLAEHPEDELIPGGTFLLGSTLGTGFIFDNEQWAYPIEVGPFSISRTAVTNAQFAAFVEAGGYRKQGFWSEAGWQWREGAGAEQPVYWQPLSGGKWLRRNFDQWVLLEDHHPVLHVNWFEAEAYCRWARRRLPSEAEWEMAASAEPTAGGKSILGRKRLFPWGDDLPSPDRANLDWRAMGCVDVDTLPAGDSAFGCRQMIGNTWEWTADDFNGYPGFTPGPYKEYSEPWFGNHKVLRGGCWATHSLLIRNTYRNFYKPERRDVWAGFRTCAL